MSTAMIAFQELLRSLTGRAWTLAGVAVLITALTVATLVGVSLIADPASPPMQSQVYAVPDPDLSQEAIGQLLQTLRADPAVAQAGYRFGPPPTDASTNASTTAEGHFALALRADANPDAARARFQGWGELQSVVKPETSPNAARVWLADNGVVVGLGLGMLTLGSLLCLYAAVREARRAFAGPTDLLQMAGAAPLTLRLPFILLGALYGATAVIALILVTLAGPIVQLGSALTSLSPTLDAPLTTFGLRGLVLGAIFGLVFGGIGALLAPVQRYPKPLSRSRISASSSGVKAPSPEAPSTDAPSDASPS